MATLAVAIGGKRLSIICQRMLEEFECYYRGMPDLIFWKIDKTIFTADNICNRMENNSNSNNNGNYNNSSGSIASNNNNNNNKSLSNGTASNNNKEPSVPVMKDTILVVEVKSNNDTLSKWQILWMELLSEANIPIEICKQFPITD